MKCIQCGTHSRRRDRPGGRCPKCRRLFAFEPATDPLKVTDAQFHNAVRRVSEEGRVQFTRKNLWYEFNRRWMKPGFWRLPYTVLPVAGIWTGMASAFSFMGPADVLPMAGAGLAGGTGLGALLNWVANRRASRPLRPPRVSFDEFTQRYLREWRQAQGEPPALLPPREQALPAMPREVPGDVAAFSFDRAVVTDSWDMAQMLVANRFHFEHNCAVLSRDGYPDGIADTVKEMLRRNPRLTVFALHDASPQGCLLPLALRAPEWFPDPSIRVVDLGLRPGTVRRLRIPARAGVPGPVPRQLAEILPPEDVAWLAEGHTAELAAVRPAQVLRAAYQGILAAERAGGSSSSGSDGGGGGGDTYYGGVIWVGDLSPGTDTAAVDGFG